MNTTEDLLLSEAKAVDATDRSPADGFKRRVLREWVGDDSAHDIPVSLGITLQHRSLKGSVLRRAWYLHTPAE